jgi:hypothetical protein
MTKHNTVNEKVAEATFDPIRNATWNLIMLVLLCIGWGDGRDIHITIDDWLNEL